MTSTPSTWHVTDTRQETAVGPSGGFVEGLRISFETGRAETGSVFLPLAAASGEQVAAAIRARVAILDEIAGLSHESSV